MSYVEGNIQRYLFYSEDSSYSVIKVKITDTDDLDVVHFEPTIIVCGFFPKLENSVNYRFYGEVANHPKYGIQYNANRFERMVDNTYEGLLDYLSSDLFKGVGIKTAERIIETLGLSALDLIAEDKHVLDKVPKMNAKLRDSIFREVVDNKEMENTLVWLYSFEISPKMAMRIYSHYGSSTIQTIKENPYILMDHIEGIGFKRADEIGLKVGFQYDSPLRIAAVIYYLLTEYMNKFGDTYLLKTELIEYTMTYLNSHPDFNVEKELVDTQLESLKVLGKVIFIEDKVSLNFLYNSELFIAKKVVALSEINDSGLDRETFESLLDDFQTFNDITYTKAQKKAIHTALNNNFSIITGGPGTGKTTVIKGLIDIYKMLHNNRIDVDAIKLAAPTGKAAKRLSEATNLKATTVHKLLGYDFEGNFKFDEYSSLEAKIIIIDEASMLDALLAKKFFSAVSSSTKVIMVGDANQLPSVGPGDVLNNLIKSKLFECVELDVIHRQAADSHIISLAYDILNKNINENFFHNYEDKEFINANDNFISSRIVEKIKQLIEKGYDFHDDIQVLIPVYKGYNGIDRINALIQSTFNQENKEYAVKFKDKEFWYNDKVMQLVNQPEDNVMNGDQGTVIGITPNDELIVDFSDNIVKYSKKDLDNLTLAYAVSIHKSQGSEFKSVIMPLTKSYTIMLKRKLLYTGVTRAKEKLILIGDFDAYRRGVLGIDRERNTLLNHFLENRNQELNSGQTKISDFL
ncbi:MAG: ATP-dependent RecD-like DNA helicase [Candidatus Izemoplasmatales bacterium]|jgi:exodeoxyribonuclease V alpha subunit|nr:ATP-dependent RecD-like DNA helicase [Candidatus Izemoplasmatales bacterium]